MTVAAPVSKGQTRAVLLAALLGDFGLHHFYLGQTSLGVLYLVFCWTGIPGVLAALEARRYGFMSIEEWAERYNDGTLGKPVPHWLPVVLFVLPLIVLVAIFAGIYAGFDF